MAPYTTTLDVLFLGVVVYLSVTDWIKKEVPLLSLLVLLVIGVASKLLRGDFLLFYWLPCILVAGIFSVIFFTRPGKLGFADLLVAPSLSLHIPLGGIPYALLLSSGLAFLYFAIIWFWSRKSNKEIELSKVKIPFIPFLSMGYFLVYLFPICLRIQ